MWKKTDLPAQTELIIKLASSYVNQKRNYETSHSELSLKIRLCSIIWQNKKNYVL